MSTKTCVVTGVGPGNGLSLVRRFAAGGYRVAMLARSDEKLRDYERDVPGARSYPTDVGDGAAVRETFARIKTDLGPTEVLLHNAGSGAFGPFDQVTLELLELSWRINTYGLLAC